MQRMNHESRTRGHWKEAAAPPGSRMWPQLRNSSYFQSRGSDNLAHLISELGRTGDFHVSHVPPLFYGGDCRGHPGSVCGVTCFVSLQISGSRGITPEQPCTYIWMDGPDADDEGLDYESVAQLGMCLFGILGWEK